MKHLIEFLFAAVLISGTAWSLPAAEWYRFTPQNAIEILCRADVDEKAFSDKALNHRTDDYAVIDFWDYHSSPGTLSGLKEFENGFTARWSRKGVEGNAECRVEPLGKNKIRYHWRLHFTTPQEIKDSYFAVRLNPHIINRKLTFFLENNQEPVEILLDPEKDGWLWQTPWNARTISAEVPLNHGVLRFTSIPVAGGTSTRVFKYGTHQGNIRFHIPSKKASEIAGSLDIEFIPYRSVPLDLSAAANMGFRDDVADDRTGGWTDQGPENDLRTMSSGDMKFSGINFRVIDPAANNGKSALVFGNPARPYFIKEATIPAGGRSFHYLYLLHASAWTKENGNGGTITVNYSDGASETINLKDGCDMGNWWSPKNRENAVVAWRGQNKTGVVGLYLSRFPLKGKEVDSFRFRSGNENVWCVAAASGAVGRNIPFSFQVEREIPYVLKPGKEWKRFAYSNGVESGSALDFSFFTGPGPAGTLGKAIVRGEEFVFEKAPEKPIRFYGGNLCFDACTMTDNELAYFPKRLKQLGYNAVRFHHFDNSLVKDSAKLEFDPEKFDRFHKTVAAMKAEGLYITIDLYISRINGFEDDRKMRPFDRKLMVWFDPAGKKNLEEYTRILLTTLNPYTGLTLAEDPALISVGLINENPRLENNEELKYPGADPFWNNLYQEPFDAWCRENNLPVTAKPDRITWARFMMESHIATFDHYKRFLQSLGVTVPVTDISCSQSLILAVPRAKFDYTDIHFYFDHPTVSTGFKLPFTYHNRSSIENYEQTILAAATTRSEGKPLMITEWHYCAPNSFRAEGGPLVGAYCALQNVNGIFDFNPVSYRRIWGDPTDGSKRVLGTFSLFEDPIALMNSYIIALFYARGDVKPATELFTLNISPEIYSNEHALEYAQWTSRKPNAQKPPEFGRLGAVYKTALRITDQTGGASSITNDEILAERDLNDPDWLMKKLGLIRDGEITSSTGEITITPAKRQFRVVTEKSEALVQDGPEQRGNALSVRNNSTFSTVFAGSLDHRKLSESSRVLLFHLTDVKAENCRYSIKDGQLIVHTQPWTPYLLRRGVADISLRNTAPGKARLYALDMTGKRTAEIPFTEQDGVICFRADNDRGELSPLAYELIRTDD